VLDFDGELLDANPAALRALGYEPDEIRSLNLGSLEAGKGTTFHVYLPMGAGVMEETK
jgi:PAS domain-containing protein